MKKLALIFPGQGSQYIKMGKALCEEYPMAQEVFEEANDTLGFNMQDLIFNGTMEELTHSSIAQPAVITASYAQFKVYMQETGIKPRCSAGHSLGEISALVAAGAMKFSDSLLFARKRGFLMHEAFNKKLGNCGLIMNISRDSLEKEIQSISGTREELSISGYNSPMQFLVAGTKEAMGALRKRMQLVKAQFVPFAMVPMRVDAPFHSGIMKFLEDDIKNELLTYEYKPMEWDVISNVTARPYESHRDIVKNLSLQMISPVQWQQTISYMEEQGIDVALELGPMNVLKKLTAENSSIIKPFSFDIPQDVEDLKEESVEENDYEYLDNYVTLTDVFNERAWDSENGITFVGEKSDEFFPYAKIYEDAIKILGVLQERGLRPGDIVVFQIIDPKDFTRFFWACVLGGFVPAPVPVDLRGNYDHQLKLYNIWNKLENKYIITSPDVLQRLEVFANEHGYTEAFEEIRARNFNFTEFDLSTNKNGVVYTPDPHDITFIQFSSGTTGDSKGVVLSHENLVTNIKDNVICTHTTPKDSSLVWLPLTHDFGLIGFHLVPTMGRCNHLFMSPFLFLTKPMLWLQKVSEHRVTFLASPNFGFKHLLRYFDPEQAQDWDLSCIRLISNGAEPISTEVCCQFLDKLEPYGLQRKSMHPAYGLAEACLAVTFSPPDDELVSITLDRYSLEIGQEIVPVGEENSNGISFVFVGSPPEGSPIRIADNNDNPLPEGVMGKIQVTGKNITRGYYKDEEKTKEAFTKDGWLKTGDLGFIKEGKLAITGREKDILFINGYNYYSHDIEVIAEETEWLGHKKVLAVGAFNEEQQRDGLLLFVVYKEDDDKFSILAASLHNHLQFKLGLQADYIIPIKSIPKTTSGKIRRSALRDEYLKGMYTQDKIDPVTLLNNKLAEEESVSVTPEYERVVQEVNKEAVSIISGLLHVKENTIDINENINNYGLNSIQATELIDLINKKYSIKVSPAVYFDHQTIASFVQYLCNEYSDILSRFYGSSAEAALAENRPGPSDTPAAEELSIPDNGVEPVAIIGISGIMPGSDTMEAFRENLEAGRDLVAEIPEDRWSWQEYYGDPVKEANKTNIKWGGFINAVDCFDAAFFGISPMEAELMDPQQRIFLETVWKTIEDAGYKASDLGGSKTGLYAGVSTSDYIHLLKENNVDANPFVSTGNSHAMLVNRISYLLDIHGPSEAVDTACSSSLVAIHRGVEAIRNKTCDLAIAGGVNVILLPEIFISFGKAGMLSPDGCCKTFDKKANGYIRGEGAGAVLLKPLSSAVAHGDNIYAVILGSAINHGGSTNSLTTPNPNAQAELLTSVYRQANIDPGTISYIETHGTGTPLGDPIEVNGLKKAFASANSPEEKHCGIGAVKTNIGHLESAAGIAGVLKVVMAMKHKKIPATIHFEQLNPYIELSGSPFYVVDTTTEWNNLIDREGRAIPLRAGVSSFGFGGTNAHILIEEYWQETIFPEVKNSTEIIILSAKNEERLNEYSRLLREYAEKQNASGNTNLRDIAFTLQTGREEMDERLALVVAGIEELVKKLSQYTNAEKNIENLFRGSCNKKTTPADSSVDGDLFNGEEGKEFVRLAIAGRKFNKLAKIWAHGGTVDWKQLYSGRAAKRISLPVYPFERKRFRVPGGETKKRTRIAWNHPLLEKNSSTFSEQKFTAQFRGTEFFLADHLVGEYKVFPGVAYIEMARAAGTVAGEGMVRKIKNIVWPRPVMTMEKPPELTMSLYPGRNDARYEVSSRDENHESVIHGQGKLIYGSPEEKSAEVTYLNINEIKERCSHSMSGEDCYTLFQSKNMIYGPRFRALKELFSNEKEVLALLELPASLRNGKEGAEEFLLHPTMLDGALQAISGLKDESGSSAGTPYLPFALGEIEILKKIPETCYAHVTETTGETQNIGIKKFNIQIVDGSGQLIVDIKDFSARALVEGAAANTKPAEKIYCRNTWVEKRPDVAASADESSQTLVFDYNHSLNDSLSNSTLVMPGKSFSETDSDGENPVYEIDPASPADYEKLVKALTAKGRFPNKIIFAWPFSGADRLHNSIYSVFYLSRALMKEKPGDPVHFLYFYGNPDEDIDPYNAAMSGFARSIGLESRKFLYKTIELKGGAGDPAELAALADYEFKALPSDGTEIRYENNKRFVREIKEIKPEEFPAADPELLKENGVYLVTGGAGGLGLIFAEYLTTQKNVTLILTGRSDLSHQKEKRLKELESRGSAIIYIKADISNKEEATRLIGQIKADQGGINGVIHGAGIIRDSFIINKTEEEINSVLAPKVSGTVHLDEALGSENLDFFVLFSSLTAVIGNSGQSDYAYANSFMDVFAEKREAERRAGERHGKTISINWPLWKEGGMTVDEKTQKIIEKYTGIGQLATAAGLDTFTRALSLEGNQVIVLEGDRGKMMKILGLAKRSAVKKQENKTKTPHENRELLRKIERDILLIVSAILKIDTREIDLEEDISSYGFGSITFTEFAFRMNDKYDLDLTPVIFFEHTSIGSFAEFLFEEYWDTFDEYYRHHKEGVPSPDSNQKGGSFRNRFAANKEYEIVHIDANAEPVAIIGMSGRYPGAANLTEFWNNLRDGVDSISEIPKERWDFEKAYAPYSDLAEEPACKWGGFLNDVDTFDPLFFNISPAEAEWMDPQLRLLLETIWEALEDAAYTRKTLSKRQLKNGEKTGVFIGSMSQQYPLIAAHAGVGKMLLNTSYWSIVNRVSYIFNFQGPSLAVDTACASSLTTVHLACESIRRGECSVAVAGGVNLCLSPSKYLALNQFGMLGSSRQSKSLGDGDGMVPGEGVGALLLKPLSLAKKDRDHIYGVIKGSMVNHGGRTSNYMVPSPNAQAELITAALKKANIDAGSISYVETAANGSALGDPIEMAGLTKAFKKHTEEKQFCAVGSVKSNIGHIEAASGIAQVTKVLLQMKHKQLVRSLNADPVNPNLKLENSPFYIQKELSAWERPEGVRPLREVRPLRAAINSFGAGGSNASIILEEYTGDEPEETVSEEITKETTEVITLSAKDETQLKLYAERLLFFLDGATGPPTPRRGRIPKGGARVSGEEPEQSEVNPCPASFSPSGGKGGMVPPQGDRGQAASGTSLKNIAYTLHVGREEMDARLAIIAGDIDEASQRLKTYIAGGEDLNIVAGNAKNKKTGILTEGDLGDEIIKLIIEKQDRVKMAQLWVDGISIPWEELYSPGTPVRIPLPTYPFKKDRYWIETSPEQENFRQVTPAKKSPTPVLSGAEASNLEPGTSNSLDRIRENLKGIVSDLLKIPEKDLDPSVVLNNYGFDSLSGMKLVNRIVDMYNIKLTPKVLFKNNSIELLAHYLLDQGIGNREIRIEAAAAKPVPGEASFYPLSSGQKGLWLIYEMAPENYAYNVPTAFKIAGEMNTAALKNAFTQLVLRHESLRAHIALQDDEYVQYIKPGAEFIFETEDLENKGGTRDDIESYIRTKVREPFNLETGPLMRVHLFSFSRSSHILLITVHHIVFDGPAFLPLSGDLLKLYEAELSGTEAALPRLKATYKDFVSWQQGLIENDQGAESREYWLRKLSGDIPALNLPTDFPRPKIQTYQGAVYREELPGELAEKIENLSVKENVSVFSLLLSAYYVLLHKYSNQEDILLGAPVAGRSKTEFEDLVGYFVNMVVLRAQVHRSLSFRDLLDTVQTTILEAMTHGDYPFYDLFREINIQKNLGQSPLFQTVFVFQNWVRSINKTFSDAPLNAAFEPMLNIQQDGVYDLTLEIIEIEESYVLHLKYNPDLFSPGTIERMAGHYRTLLDTIIANPGQKIRELDLLTGEEKQDLLVEYNKTAKEFPRNKCIHELFEEQVEKTPGSIAVQHGDESITYRELNNRANTIAGALLEKGAAPNRITGIMLDRSPDMAAGILGTLKAGSAYAPIDLQYPGERIEHMLESCGAGVVLTKESAMHDRSFTTLQDLQQTNGIIHCTAKREQIADLNSLPIPDRSLVNYDEYGKYIGQAMVKHCMSIQGTRGCPYKCAYCHKIWPKTHVYRSAENIFEEIRLYYNMGVRRFAIIDDIFNQNRKNSTRFFQLIIKNKLDVQLFFPNGMRGDILTKDYIDLMVEAGVVNLALALETASPRLQKLIRKNINLDKLRENVDYFCEKHPQVILEFFTMHGFPTETEEEAMLTLDFIKSSRWLHFPYVHILRIYPNTDMEKLALENGVSREQILRSANTAWHELPETLPFDKSFSLSYQADFLNEYFLSKERLEQVLFHERKIMTEDEVVQKYNSYLPMEINSFSDLVSLAGGSASLTTGSEFISEEKSAVPNLNASIQKHFKPNKPANDALKILFLDLSQFFSDESGDMLYDVVDPPLGLMYVQTYLNKEFGEKVNGKIAKARIDFNSFDELKKLVNDFKPDLVGLRTLTFYKDLFHKSASLIKQWIDVPIIAGGPYGTSDYASILQDRNIDLVVLSEGEATTAELVGEILKNNRKLPGEETLKTIPGIALSPKDENVKTGSAREIIMLDHLPETAAGEIIDNPKRSNKPDDLIYTIFTSGSTGKPKGAGVYHRSFMNLMNWYADEFNINEHDRLLLMTSLSFDLTQKNIYAPLITGGTLHIPESDVFDPALLVREIDSNEISLLNCTPGMFYNILEAGSFDQLSSLRQVFLGGEPISMKKLHPWLRSSRCNAEVVNTYGPTECTDICAYYRVDKNFPEERTIPIGSAINNAELYVLDSGQKPVPIGVPGELYISGQGVGFGYLNDEKLTAEKFMKNPFAAQQLMYRSGDLVKRLDNGSLEYLERVDNQVKVRGFRIELGEIENRLLNHERVKEATVQAMGDTSGDKTICAYVVPGSSSIDILEIKEFLAQTLPDYMVPSYIMFVDRIPLNANGKVNKKALPLPENDTGMEYIAPSSDIEKKLAEIWGAVLETGVETIGVNANFFDIGGHSLKAAVMASKIRNEFNISVPLAEMLKAPTIKSIARYIANTVNEEGACPGLPVDENIVLLKKSKKNDEKNRNLFFIHAGSGEIDDYIELSSGLHDSISCYGIKADRFGNFTPKNISVEETAQKYVAMIEQVQEDGPYNIFGWCIGGGIAFEIVKQLEEKNKETGMLAIADSVAPEEGFWEAHPDFTADSEKEIILSLLPESEIKDQIKNESNIQNLWPMVVDSVRNNKALSANLTTRFHESVEALIPNHGDMNIKDIIYLWNVIRSFSNSQSRYIPGGEIKTPIHIFKAADSLITNSSAWKAFSAEESQIYSIPGNHYSIFAKPGVAEFSSILNAILDK
ncbi:MAG: SDR family NAD(P)-dependent oxidoreductase [bacterium]|nr:SDR family NAD(P)-dependent oxidoreductase [bacterium]